MYFKKHKHKNKKAKACGFTGNRKEKKVFIPSNLMEKVQVQNKRFLEIINIKMQY